MHPGFGQKNRRRNDARAAGSGRFMRAGRIAMWAALCVIGSGAVSLARGAMDGSDAPVSRARAARSMEIARILSALRTKVADHQVLANAREKLAALSDEQLRLIASLSRPMVESRQTLVGNIAFLLVTSLLVLS